MSGIPSSATPRHPNRPEIIDLRHAQVALCPDKIAPGLEQVQLGIINLKPDLDAEFIPLFRHLDQPLGLFDRTGECLEYLSGLVV